MSKIEINNEIVLMRRTVRRARLHVVRKLIKQSKMLGVKKGDEKQREKYKRKGDKLGQELVSIKKIKDDEISRYSITNERKLEEVLADQKSDPETCVLARLADHKLIRDRVAEFKLKFPNFTEHLGPGKRKLIKLKRKAGKQAKKDAKVNAQMEKDDSNDETKGEKDSEESGEEIEESLSKNEENEEPKSQDEIINGKRKSESTVSENKRIKTRSKNLPEVKPREVKPSKAKGKVDELPELSVMSKEATVKSFSRFLEEEDGESPAIPESENKSTTNEDKIILEKEVDSFFMTEDGAGEYLSIVVPKSNVAEDQEDEENGVEGLVRPRNNRFFDKVDSRSVERPKYKNNEYDNRGKGNSVRGGRFKERNESRDKNTVRNFNTDTKTRRDFAGSEKKSSANESVHPSWAAKKKQQEILKLGFQGKKIVFDDAS